MRIAHVVGNVVEPLNGIGAIAPEFVLRQNDKRGIESVLIALNGSELSSSQIIDFNVVDSKMEAFFANFDIVVFHGVFFFKYIKIAKCLVRIRVKYLIKPHSSLVKDALEKSFLKKKLALALFFDDFLKKSEALIYTSVDEHSKSTYKFYRHLIEPNGINPPYKTNIKTCYDLGREFIRFIYVGRIDFNHKGLDFLLDALDLLNQRSKLDKIEFKFYGKGDRKEESKLISRISAFKNRNIMFLGPLWGEAKEKALKESDVFVLTSRYEGVPVAVIEALSYGLPCLLTNGVNLNFANSRYQFAWVTDTKAEDIANTIDEICKTSSNHFAKMGRNGRKYVEAEHNWDSVIDISLANYNTILRLDSL